MKKNIKVSACIITYNHEKFISQCLDAAISQNHSYLYEIVIGDDCSTDGTLEICKAYQKKHPDLIRIIERDKNLGITGNWSNSFDQCQGDYIAVCEGDDYWTDTSKIQKQVDFLVNNPNVSLTIHNAIEVIGNDKTPMVEKDSSGYVSDFDIINKKIRIPTLSMIFPKKILANSNSIMNSGRSADRPLEILCINNGEVYYFEDVMGIKITLPTGSLAQFKKEGIKSTLLKFESNQFLLKILKKEKRSAMYYYLSNVAFDIFKKKPLQIGFLIKFIKYRISSYKNHD